MADKSLKLKLYPSLVLVIEDDMGLQMQLQQCLEQEGHRVVTASNGEEGLNTYQDHQPDLVLLDTMMMPMDGFECCARLREQSEAEYRPILMMTEPEEQESVERAFQVGAADYLAKPIHWAVLKQRVKRLIYQARLQKNLEVAHQRLEELTLVDGLTQVSNRRHFEQSLEKEWKRGTREKYPISLIMCDIDDFKSYNDTYGHLSGDICLQQITQTIKKQAQRPSDLVARYGGEEFAILLGNTDVAGAQFIAQKIQTAIAALKIPHQTSSVSPWVTVSLGLASLVPEANTPAAILVEQADMALYLAKEQGRDRISIFGELFLLNR